MDMSNSIEHVKHNVFFTRALGMFLKEYKKNIKEKGEFSVAFSGGNTPKPLFKLLVNEDIHWDKVHIFMVDERYLPIDDPDSNYGNIYETFLSKINIPTHNIRYIKHLGSLKTSHNEYEYEVEQFFKEREHGFDLIILGMGIDGHTASLFLDNIHMQQDVVYSLANEYHSYSRISLGINLINSCRKKIFLLTKDKEETLSELHLKNYPASKVVGDITYLLEN